MRPRQARIWLQIYGGTTSKYKSCSSACAVSAKTTCASPSDATVTAQGLLTDAPGPYQRILASEYKAVKDEKSRRGPDVRLMASQAHR